MLGALTGLAGVRAHAGVLLPCASRRGAPTNTPSLVQDMLRFGNSSREYILLSEK